MSTRTRKFGPERMFIQTHPTHFPAQFSNTPNARMPPPRCPWAARPINACCPKRLPLVQDVLDAAEDGSSSPRPQGFFINGFFIVARSLNIRSPLLVRQAQWQWRSTREGKARKGCGDCSLSEKKRDAAARGDPDASPPPTPALRWHMKDEHVKGAVAEGVAEGVPQDVAQDLGFGARAARALIATPPAPPPPPPWCSSR